MSSIVRLSILASLLVAFGCSSIDTQFDYDPSVDFSGYTSYHLKTDLKIPGDVLQSNDFVRQRLYTAIENELKKKGLKVADEANADLIVVTYAGVKDKVNLSSYGYSAGPYYGGYGYHGYYGGSYSTTTVVTHYNEGTVHIEVMDAKKKALIWKGQGTGVIEQANSPQEREANVIEAVEEILYQFPPRR